ncbi:hypothetical protein BS47DRAFT_1485324 [Hydnum rufescens UP504]|uniref:Uncharacterized protein n=1 Tax=Hydnum rufescens UP504 TaxID=1448309 RepID=A0A9P6DWP7_9AGAM|nr:hypothetical protein BS47DRAFT_1485324 [Hydnum rufescens UP504]
METRVLKDLGSLWWLTHARISNGSFHSASAKLDWLCANAVQFTASVSAGLLAIMAGVLYIRQTYMIYPSFVPPGSRTLPHYWTITFPTTTSNSQPRTAADGIKVKAYLMKQQRELLGRNNPSPPSDLKVAANEKQTDEVARITGDVEAVKARNVHLSLDTPPAVPRCTNNSGSRCAHHVDLDLLQQDLIDHYPKVKGMLPLFVSEEAWAEDERGRE